MINLNVFIFKIDFYFLKTESSLKIKVVEKFRVEIKLNFLGFEIKYSNSKMATSTWTSVDQIIKACLEMEIKI